MDRTLAMIVVPNLSLFLSPSRVDDDAAIPSNSYQMAVSWQLRLTSYEYVNRQTKPRTILNEAHVLKKSSKEGVLTRWSREQGKRSNAVCCMFAMFGKILKPQAQDCQCLANNRCVANNGLTVEEPLTPQGNLSCL